MFFRIGGDVEKSAKLASFSYRVWEEFGAYQVGKAAGAGRPAPDYTSIWGAVETATPRSHPGATKGGGSLRNG